jgi:hypothetical protein
MSLLSLSPEALAIIDGYLHFKVGLIECSVPYFNNKTVASRGGLRAQRGKGSPEDIQEEILGIFLKHHTDINALTSESLKKTLTDQNLGIDCSAFAYHILDAEHEVRGLGSIEGSLTFVNCKGLFGRLICSMRPAENCDVTTLADDINTRIITLTEIIPGDLITMIGGPDSNDRNHVLVVHEVERDGNILKSISYSHAIAYPEDGLYGSGIRQGTVEIVSPTGSILDQIWKESGMIDGARRIFGRAKASRTEIRRLKKL